MWTKRSPNASSPGSAPRAKRKKPVSHDSDSDSDIDINQCCVCFQTFEDDEREQSGLEWVECACSRWLHEECIEYDLSVNSRGQVSLLCPYRLSLLSNYVNISKNIKFCYRLLKKILIMLNTKIYQIL